jgi:hypothetical protein
MLCKWAFESYSQLEALSVDPRLTVPPLMIELYLLELSARFLPLQPIKNTADCCHDPADEAAKNFRLNVNLLFIKLTQISYIIKLHHYFRNNFYLKILYL